MVDTGQHAVCVDTWLDRNARDVSSKDLLGLFEAALGALWARTKTPLGEVTLTAIADRVLHNAAEKFPFFSSLRVEPAEGIQFGGLHERRGSLQAADLTQGIRFVLVELLTVLGNLTSEILTPELHAELSRVTPAGAPGVEKRAPGPPGDHQGTEAEDKGS